MRMRTALVCVTAGLAVISCTTTARVEAHPAATNACSSAVSISGFSDALDKTTFEDTYVGNLSALAVDTDGTTAALSDRSSLFGLDARTHRPVRVVQLADETGTALDSEALVVDQDGTRLVTDETAPAVRRYDRSGTLVGRLPVPAALLVAPAGRATKNLTFEGLALQPGGRTLIASMEGALSGDSSDIVRLQTWRRHSSKSAFRPAEQYGYRVGTGLGISEIAAPGTAACSSWNGATPPASATPSASTSPTPVTPPTPAAPRTSPDRTTSDWSARPSSPTSRTARRWAPPPNSPSPTPCSTTSRASPSPAARPAAHCGCSWSATTTRAPPRPPGCTR